MIVFDTEGTDLIKPEVLALDQQPKLVEFAGIKLDKELQEVDRLQFYCSVDTPLPELFKKITGITEETIKDAPSFANGYNKLWRFFLGETEMTAHNMGYDSALLKFSLMRIDRLLNFPWPVKHICTVEASAGIKGHRLSLSDLYMMAEGKTPEERLEFRTGAFVKHKTLGKGTILALDKEKLTVQFETSKKTKTLSRNLFTGAAFEGAHGAMKDVEQLVTIVRWLRQEGHL